MSPQIISPAPCLPALLESDDRRFTIVVRHDETTIDVLRTWVQTLQLADAHDTRIPVRVDTVDIIRASEVGEHSAAAAACFGIESRWARLTCSVPELPQPVAPRSVRVFSLVRGATVERRNCVAVFAPGSEVRLAFASDLHVAEMWDGVAEAVARHTPEFLPATRHPNLQLDRFVTEANQLAARGLLDLVILGGDLVDHVHTEPRVEVEKGSNDNNLERLLELLAPLEVPVVAIPGNHDYRQFPWRPRAYGLGSIGLSDTQNRRFLQAAGWWGRWPLHWNDFDALRTQRSGASPLARHCELLAPATDFRLRARGLQLVFANTGRDAVLDWRRIEPERRSLMMRSLTTSWVDPDSEGLNVEQVQRIAEALTAGPTAVFFHAPLLHPRPWSSPPIIDLNPGDNDDLASDIRFEQNLQRTRQRGGVMFRNPAALMRACRDAAGSVTIFTGHVHKATAVMIERNSLQARIAPFQPAPNPEAVIPVLTAPSLGHWRRPGGEGPGYLLATLRNGRLIELERRHVSEMMA